MPKIVVSIRPLSALLALLQPLHFEHFITCDCHVDVGLESVLPAVSHAWQRQLLHAFTALDGRLGAKSASKAACLRLVASIVSQPRRFGYATVAGAFPVVLPEEVAAWLKASHPYPSNLHGTSAVSPLNLLQHSWGLVA